MDMETKDLILKESVIEELDTFYEWEKMPEVAEFFSISKNQTKEDVYEEFFEKKNDPQVFQFSIFQKQDEEGAAPKLIGRAIITDYIEDWKCEIWRLYIADTSLRNKGFGRQALLALMELCFCELNLERVYLDYYTGNPAAYLYEKLGFKEEGVLRKNCRKDGVLHDVHLMSMLRSEYKALYK